MNEIPEKTERRIINIFVENRYFTHMTLNYGFCVSLSFNAEKLCISDVTDEIDSILI
jgi:hypothetical protein